jgi:hypothetical protein
MHEESSQTGEVAKRNRRRKQTPTIISEFNSRKLQNAIEEENRHRQLFNIQLGKLK